MSVLKITKDNFNNEVLNSNQTVLIDFWANWCGPCRMLSPIVDEIAAETTGVKICKVNVDEEPELSQAFQVSSIPMLAVVKNGKLVNKAVGVRPKAAIKQMLNVS